MGTPDASDPPRGPPRIAFVAAASAVHATAMIAALTCGDDPPVRFDLVPATLPLNEIVKRLNELRPPVLGGYASMLAQLAPEARAGCLQITPTLVSSTSETLLPRSAQLIRGAFGVPVLDSFGSTEGLVGKTGPDDDVFVFNTDMCIVELSMPTTARAAGGSVRESACHQSLQPDPAANPLRAHRFSSASPLPSKTAICGPAYEGATTTCCTTTRSTSIRS